jgi:hypothetical protein
MPNVRLWRPSLLGTYFELQCRPTPIIPRPRESKWDISGLGFVDLNTKNIAHS